MNARSLFSFRGRIGRGEFWLVSAISTGILAAVGASWLAYAISMPGAYENGGPAPLPDSALGILAAIVIAGSAALSLVALAAVCVRRLHDRDKSWWWILLYLVLPQYLALAVGRLSAADESGNELSFVAAFAAFALAAWASVELGCLRGTSGANRFGAAPPLTAEEPRRP